MGVACLFSTMSELQLEVLNTEVDLTVGDWNHSKAHFLYAWCLVWENLKARTADWSASVASQCDLEHGVLRVAQLLQWWLRATSVSSSEQGRSHMALFDRT